MASQSSLGPVKSKPWQACFLLIRLFWWDSRDPRPSEATWKKSFPPWSWSARWLEMPCRSLCPFSCRYLASTISQSYHPSVGPECLGGKGHTSCTPIPLPMRPELCGQMIWTVNSLRRSFNWMKWYLGYMDLSHTYTQVYIYIIIYIYYTYIYFLPPVPRSVPAATEHSEFRGQKKWC
jgi:hypothetical protein